MIIIKRDKINNKKIYNKNYTKFNIFKFKNIKLKQINKKKKKKINSIPIYRNILYIQSNKNNTIATFTNKNGNIIFWRSAGIYGFKGTKKRTPIATKRIAENIINIIKKNYLKLNIKGIGIKIKGSGLGRDIILRTLLKSNIILLNFIQDITSIPHNGCRPPKRRRL
uniref:ribosomal protein S11 n=1 Tax=Sarcophyte sanguinea TaxID=1618143 RepID=UPI0026E1C972|nr:ribosomal protein S11 [Sarcophyte sanguinea]WJE89103.1 ribosomal protein S11 [Sarcophyte sanguinea]WJE89122.1 ribosomal protein S11 [Sarcophyte sanguinea]